MSDDGESDERLGLRASDECSPSRLIPLCSYLHIGDLMEYLESPEFQPTSSDDTGAPVVSDDLLSVLLADSHDGSTYMHALAQRRNFASVFSCLEFLSILVPFSDGDPEAAVNRRDRIGQTPLHVACVLGNKRAVHALLRWSVDVDTRDNRGLTALELSCLMGHVDIVKTLLDVTVLDWPRLFEMASSHAQVLEMLAHYRHTAPTTAVIGSVRNRDLKLQSERDKMEQEAPAVEEERLNVYRRVTDEELRNSIKVIKRLRASRRSY